MNQSLNRQLWDDQADTFTPTREGGEDAEREPGRRRRRRRRGGRRDDARGGEVRGGDRVEGDRPARVSPRDEASIDDDDIEPWEPEIDAVEPVDDWAEPASFSASDLDVDADVDPDAPLPQTSLQPSSTPRSRSQRASRRQPATSHRTGERTARTTAQRASLAKPGNLAKYASHVNLAKDAKDANQPDLREHRARPGRWKTLWKSKHDQSARDANRAKAVQLVAKGDRVPRAKPRREPVAPEDDLDNQVDSSLAAELEGDDAAGNRHPKIPTWADSLEAIIKRKHGKP